MANDLGAKTDNVQYVYLPVTGTINLKHPPEYGPGQEELARRVTERLQASTPQPLPTTTPHRD